MEIRQRNGKITEYNVPFIEQRADPYILRHTDGKYYFTATVPEYDRIVLRTAESIEGLAATPEKVLWRAHESGEMSCHIWAPELHFLFGKWYIYFAAGEKENVWKIRPFVLECTTDDPMSGEWIEKGKMQCADDDIYSFRAFSLDSTVFEHKGSWYFVWAEKVSVGIQISNLYIARMESATKLATAQVLLSTPDYDWERVNIWVNEAPTVVKHDGRIYLAFSASATGSEYCVGLMSIGMDEELLDPHAWVKERKPILTSDADRELFGPGHNTFTEDENGSPLCVFHARTYPDIVGDPLNDPNRHAYVMRVEWGTNGHPVLDCRNLL